MARLRWTGRERAISRLLKAQGFARTLADMNRITETAAAEEQWRPSERAMAMGRNVMDCRDIARRIGIADD